METKKLIAHKTSSSGDADVIVTRLDTCRSLRISDNYSYGGLRRSANFMRGDDDILSAVPLLALEALWEELKQ